MKIKIYVLKNERGVVRYVGKTKSKLWHRLRNHIYTARAGECTHRAKWIRSMLARKLEPTIHVIANVIGNGNSAEIKLIAKLRRLGFKLTNGTAGGDGVVNPTAATRAKMRAAKLGKKLTREHRRKIAMAGTGRKHSAETLAKMRKSRANVKITDEWRRNIGLASRGRKFPPHEIERRSEWMKARWREKRNATV